MRITKKKALKLLKRAVQERGKDYVYPAGFCEYFIQENDGCLPLDEHVVKEHDPACMIGLVLSYLGVTYKDVRQHNDDSVDSLFAAHDMVLRTKGGGKIQVTQAGLHVFQAAQNVQDGGRTWGEALEEAERASKDEI